MLFILFNASSVFSQDLENLQPKGLKAEIIRALEDFAWDFYGAG